MNIQFSGKTALVTGAAQGFGRAIAQALTARVAKVWVCDLLAEELAETVRMCREAGGDCTARTVNVTDREAVGALVAEAGPIDILVNNAGGVLGQVGRPLEEITPQQWQAIFDVNVTAAFYCCLLYTSRCV